MHDRHYCIWFQLWVLVSVKWDINYTAVGRIVFQILTFTVLYLIERERKCNLLKLKIKYFELADIICAIHGINSNSTKKIFVLLSTEFVYKNSDGHYFKPPAGWFTCFPVFMLR